MFLLIVGIIVVVVGVGYVVVWYFLELIEVFWDCVKLFVCGWFDDGEDIDVNDDEFGEFVEVFDDMQENF